MAERVECAVIGAGVVGLAVARALAQAGREVVIVEAADAIGTHTSSRNSEVIHAGIYYDTGSLKARLCVAGRDALYAFCRDHGVEHRAVGKLIVATGEAQLPELERIRAKAAANGAGDLVWLDAAAARAREPAVRCVGALLSPLTGIIDSHGLMLAYLGDAQAAGAMLALNTPVVGGRAQSGRIRLDIGGTAPLQLDCGLVVNSAGLFAPDLARRIDGLDPARIPPARYAKGNYFTLPGRAPFNGLVYPVPEQAGLGVHVTLDLGGQARFGPDVEWVESIDYRVDPTRAAVFYDAIRRYWPDLPDGALQPGYAGIRPKIQGPGEPARDFHIEGPAAHGTPGYVALYGIESPGLTASLAIADMVAAMAEAG